MNGRIYSSILRGLHSSFAGRSALFTGPPLAAHTVPFTDCGTSRSEHLPNLRPIQTAVAALEQRLQVSAAAFSSCAPWLSRCQRHASTSAPAAAAAAAEATHDRAASSSAASSSAAEEQLLVTPGRVQHTPAPPWTPTRELRKRNFLPRRMGHLMQVLEDEALEKAAAAKSLPDFTYGHILELKLVVPENKGRPATVKGVCIARRNRGWRTSFTILNHIAGGGIVERSFPLYSPTIQSISVLGRRRVRRAKLYYLRDRKPSTFAV